MRNIFLIFLLLLSTGILEAQFVNFDSSEVIASSPNYDYRNPTHCSNPSENVLNFNFNLNWMAYEKHSNDSTSNIVVKGYNFNEYTQEVEITSDLNVKNINPSISGEEDNYVLVWQSNKRGNWDMYYSIYNGNMWSPAALIDSSNSDEINPSIIHEINNSSHILSYTIDDDIGIKVFQNGWILDTIISKQDSILSNPSFGGGFYTVYLSFLQSGSDSIKRIHMKTIFYNSNSQALEWGIEKVVNYNNPGPPAKLPAFGNFITFDGDTLGQKRAYYYSFNGNYYEILADSLKGDLTKATSNQFPIVTDGINFIQAFAAQYRNGDSTYICAVSNYHPQLFPGNYKYFYIGDSTTNSKLSMSNVCYGEGVNEYYIKYRVVWEQEVNGRIALIESYMTDFSVSIISPGSNLPTNFVLHQNYPNPFNPSTSIKFEIPSSVRGGKSKVRLSVYDIAGKEVGVLVNSELQPGVYEYNFDGSGLGSGVYFYKLQSGEFIQTRRMVLVK